MASDGRRSRHNAAMGVKGQRRAARNNAKPGRLHWSGLHKPARQVAVFVLALTLLVDLLLIALDYEQHGRRGISGGYYLVDFWDVAKALAAGAALLVAAQRGRSRAIRVLALVFILLAVEDLIGLHGYFGAALKALSGGLVPVRLGELIAFVGFGLLVFGLVWAGKPPRDQQLRRARLVVTVLLFALFLFTGLVDYFAGHSPTPLSLLEESGERFVLTVSAAYAAGLAATRSPDDRRRRAVRAPPY